MTDDNIGSNTSFPDNIFSVQGQGHVMMIICGIVAVGILAARGNGCCNDGTERLQDTTLQWKNTNVSRSD